MTTTKYPATITPGARSTIGSRGYRVTAMKVTIGEFTYDLYRTETDEWWQDCGYCEKGFKSWYAGVYGGVCFQCGGLGYARVGGTQHKVLSVLRARSASRRSAATSAQRNEERKRAAVEEWSMANPNLASDLARVRAYDTLGGNVLGELAITASRQPLTMKQHAYAVVLLAERAYVEAHKREDAHLRANVGDKVTVSGTLTVAHLLRSERFDRSDRMLIVLDHTNADGQRVLVRTVTSARWAFNVDRGDQVTISGNVADFSDDKYGKQTALKNPKIQEGRS